MVARKAGEWNVSVRRSYAGLGLFAEEEIPKGAAIIEYTGRIITKDEEAKSRSRYLFEVGKTKTIDGQSRANTARYINHSCRPNCEPSITKGRVFIKARRKIKAGEELAYDYGKDYFNQMLKGLCRCPKCAEKPAARKRA
jgi:SET domain-containing protein